jgi:hypothetical protein
MRFRRLSLWMGLVAVLISSGCCCHHHCGWRHRRCCAPACGTTCCHPGDEGMSHAYPVSAPASGPIYSAPPIASSPTLTPMTPLLPAPMPSAK